MGRWRALAVVSAFLAGGVLNGCELGWDFLKEGGGSGNAGAQIGLSKQPSRYWSVPT